MLSQLKYAKSYKNCNMNSHYNTRGSKSNKNFYIYKFLKII